MFVHTTGEGYLDGEQMTIQSGNFNATFTLDKVAGPIDVNGIKIAKNGGNYQPGDVLKINGGGFDASFTLTAVNDAPLPKKKDSKKPNPMSGLLSKLSGIQGNLSQVLSFQNVKTDVFDFELPPNPAVSDFYQLARGGASQAESQIPSLAALAKNVNAEQLIPDAEKTLEFIQPSKSQPNINRLLSKAEDKLDDAKDTFGIG